MGFYFVQMTNPPSQIKYFDPTFELTPLVCNLVKHARKLLPLRFNIHLGWQLKNL
jgi:hypothetical protein